MFWADKVAQELKKRKLPLEWVDDMKTPSGRIHVGSLFGVVFHDLVFRALQDQGVKAKYTYVFENHDPMDDIPSYLPRAKFEKYLGMPLFKIPSPVEGYKDFAEYYALEFKKTFNAIGSHPKIIWTKDLYTSGKMNTGIKTILENSEEIRKIYKELYKKEIASDWYPFQVYCEKCGKVSTTRVYNWDGKYVHYRCLVTVIDWTKGCGYEGKTSPFSDKSGIKGKMPWKVEWAVKWQAIGVTVEGAGKDHMSRGGSHDLASLVAKRVLKYPVPYPIGYEFMLIGGKKMSSSKGRGFAASDILTILPIELARFLIVKTDIKQQTNFDPTEKDTIPKLFDEYQKAADAYFSRAGSSGNKTGAPDSIGDEDLARIFELSQINGIKKPPKVRFSVLAQWIQMPNMQEEIKKEGLEEWSKYARIWIDKYAPDSEKFIVQKNIPDSVIDLSDKQKEYLKKVGEKYHAELSAEELQLIIYELSKKINLSSKEAFSAIYTALLGKNHGPKAAWLIKSQNAEFVKKRFNLVSSKFAPVDTSSNKVNLLEKPELFSIHKDVKQKFPTISIGIATIKGVSIEKSNPKLEKEKQELLESLSALSTEQLGQYPEVVSYRKLYKEMGIDWHSRRPSPEALLRRLALNKGLYTINTCVDAYNLVVMRHRISVGAFDLDTIKFPTVLRFAKTGEEILLLGDSEPTKYKEKEIAYFDKISGYNIDFNFRDSQRTAVNLETKNLYINVDGVYDITSAQVENVLTESCNVILKYCGGTIETQGIVTA